MGFFFVATTRQSEDCRSACLFRDTSPRHQVFMDRAGPTDPCPAANQKSDVTAPHNVTPTSNTAQSRGVNPNSLPWFKTWAIIAVLVVWSQPNKVLPL
jgi:hypothetical protein